RSIRYAHTRRRMPVKEDTPTPEIVGRVEAGDLRESPVSRVIDELAVVGRHSGRDSMRFNVGRTNRELALPRMIGQKTNPAVPPYSGARCGSSITKRVP